MSLLNDTHPIKNKLYSYRSTITVSGAAEKKILLLGHGNGVLLTSGDEQRS